MRYFKTPEREHSLGTVIDYWEMDSDFCEIRKVTFYNENPIFISCHPLSSLHFDKLAEMDFKDCFNGDGSVNQYFIDEGWKEIKQDRFMKVWTEVTSIFEDRWLKLKESLQVGQVLEGWLSQLEIGGQRVGSYSFEGFSGFCENSKFQGCSAYTNANLKVLGFDDENQTVMTEILEIAGRHSNQDMDIVTARWNSYHKLE